MRRDCQPCWIKKDGDHLPLKRLSLTGKDFSENWLQDILNRNPDILPISELDASFSPAVSLGREIISIDNLFISPLGRITIVETKLWRNPEATRKVLAQILDYAQRLSQMSYEEFEDTLSSAMKPAPIEGKSLYELVKEACPKEVDEEPKFIDEVQRNLKQARFMLLIVGDGIRENIEDMVGLLHQQAQMLFTFGLVELQMYEGPDIQGRLVVPQIVAHTNEIERAVVRIEGEGAEQRVSVSVDTSDGGKKTGSRRTLSESEYMESLSPGEQNIVRAVDKWCTDHGLNKTATTRGLSWKGDGGSIYTNENSVRTNWSMASDPDIHRSFRAEVMQEAKDSGFRRQGGTWGGITAAFDKLTDDGAMEHFLELAYSVIEKAGEEQA